MITNHDRSGWFGASDTSYIMGKWSTPTFKRWWLQKLGLSNDRYVTRAMNAGTYYEHAILDFVGAPRKDHQIIIPEWLLRVNLDGDGPGYIYEVKTHEADKPFKVKKAYWQQVQVQAFAKLHEEGEVPQIEIVSYALTDDDYNNFFNDIDPTRICIWSIVYDGAFVERYLQRLGVLQECLLKGVFPNEN